MRLVLSRTQNFQIIGVALAIMVTLTGHTVSQIEHSSNIIIDDGYQEWNFSGVLSLSQEIKTRSNEVLYVSMTAGNISSSTTTIIRPSIQGFIANMSSHTSSTPTLIPGTSIQGFIAKVIHDGRTGREVNAIEEWLNPTAEQRTMEITKFIDKLFTLKTERSTSSSEMASLAIALSQDLSLATELLPITQNEFNIEQREGWDMQYSIRTNIVLVYRDGSNVRIYTYGSSFFLQFIKLDRFYSGDDGVIMGPIWKDERADYPTYKGDFTEVPLANFIDILSSW